MRQMERKRTTFCFTGSKNGVSHDTILLQNLIRSFFSALYLVHLFIFNVAANCKQEAWYTRVMIHYVCK